MMTNQLVQLIMIEIKSLDLHNNIYYNIYNNNGGRQLQIQDNVSRLGRFN